MKIALTAALVLLLPPLAHADVEARFDALRESSEKLGALGAFLQKYVGDCADPLEGPMCRQNAAQFRKTVNGKKHYMIVHEDAATMLSSGPYNPGKGEYVINVTPFFGAAGYAITQGSPKRTDGNGNPVMPLIQIKGKIKEGWSGTTFQGLFTRRDLRVQVVFTPQGTWSLPKQRGGKMEGINARIDAILITQGRTGDQLGAWYAR